MKKINIAVFFGGKSSEYKTSLMSSYHVISNLNTNKYNISRIGITKSNHWYLYSGDTEKILDDTWHLDKANLTHINIDLTDSKIMAGEKSISLDIALVVMHGRYGEDGSIQGLLKLLDIPIAGCGQLASAVGMNKKMSHQLVSSIGVNVTNSVTVSKYQSPGQCEQIISSLNFPLFIKPLNGGSSIGMSKIKDSSEVKEALKLAFSEDAQAIVEEEISGFEVGCGIIGDKNITLSCVDEIFLDGCVFDYNEKYTQTTAKLILPARINQETARKVKETALTIYKAMDCKGFARVDMFISHDNQIYFNEINTIPGLTMCSRFLKMFNEVGLSYEDMLDLIIKESLDD